MNQPVRIVFPVSETSLQIADEIFEVIARTATSDTKKRHHILTVLSEAFSNAYIHGDKVYHDGGIELETHFNENKFSASIINKGKGFADSKMKNRSDGSDYAESGRGLKIIKKLSDKVEFKRINGNKFGVFIEIDLSPEEERKTLT
jgi:anti-sigma regulatory factor (Ser/Thr protein kinase)